MSAEPIFVALISLATAAGCLFWGFVYLGEKNRK